jgi:hypothetical protein
MPNASEKELPESARGFERPPHNPAGLRAVFEEASTLLIAEIGESARYLVASTGLAELRELSLAKQQIERTILSGESLALQQLNGPLAGSRWLARSVEASIAFRAAIEYDLHTSPSAEPLDLRIEVLSKEMRAGNLSELWKHLLANGLTDAIGAPIPFIAENLAGRARFHPADALDHTIAAVRSVLVRTNLDTDQLNNLAEAVEMLAPALNQPQASLLAAMSGRVSAFEFADIDSEVVTAIDLYTRGNYLSSARLAWRSHIRDPTRFEPIELLAQSYSRDCDVGRIVEGMTNPFRRIVVSLGEILLGTAHAEPHEAFINTFASSLSVTGWGQSLRVAVSRNRSRLPKDLEIKAQTASATSLTPRLLLGLPDQSRQHLAARIRLVCPTSESLEFFEAISDREPLTPNAPALRSAPIYRRLRYLAINCRRNTRMSECAEYLNELLRIADLESDRRIIAAELVEVLLESNAGLSMLADAFAELLFTEPERATTLELAHRIAERSRNTSFEAWPSAHPAWPIVHALAVGYRPLPPTEIDYPWHALAGFLEHYELDSPAELIGAKLTPLPSAFKSNILIAQICVECCTTETLLGWADLLGNSREDILQNRLLLLQHAETLHPKMGPRVEGEIAKVEFERDVWIRSRIASRSHLHYDEAALAQRFIRRPANRNPTQFLLALHFGVGEAATLSQALGSDRRSVELGVAAHVAETAKFAFLYSPGVGLEAQLSAEVRHLKAQTWMLAGLNEDIHAHAAAPGESLLRGDYLLSSLDPKLLARRRRRKTETLLASIRGHLDDQVRELTNQIRYEWLVIDRGQSVENDSALLKVAFGAEDVLDCLPLLLEPDAEELARLLMRVLRSRMQAALSRTKHFLLGAASTVHGYFSSFVVRLEESFGRVEPIVRSRIESAERKTINSLQRISHCLDIVEAPPVVALPCTFRSIVLDSAIKLTADPASAILLRPRLTIVDSAGLIAPDRCDSVLAIVVNLLKNAIDKGTRAPIVVSAVSKEHENACRVSVSNYLPSVVAAQAVRRTLEAIWRRLARLEKSEAKLSVAAASNSGSGFPRILQAVRELNGSVRDITFEFPVSDGRAQVKISVCLPLDRIRYASIAG